MSDMARREGLVVGINARVLYQVTEEQLPETHSCIMTQMFLVFGTEMFLLPVGLMLATDISLMP